MIKVNRPLKRNKIISLEVDHISFANALELVTKWGKDRTSSYTCFANGHMTIEAYKDKEFADYVNQANLVVADGKPLAISNKILYGVDQERIAGMDFMPAIINSCAHENLTVFLFGSTDEVLSKLSAKISEAHPNLTIAGTISPPFRALTNEEIQRYVDQINNSKANVVLVGMGCPKQEIWMARNFKNINATLLGVGGAFSVYAGLVTRAPRWMQKLALEWLYRLAQEPKRMWKRYLITNTMFVYLLAKQLLLKK